MNDIEAAARALLRAIERGCGIAGIAPWLAPEYDTLRSALAHAARGEGEEPVAEIMGDFPTMKRCWMCGVTSNDTEPADGTKDQCRDRRVCRDRARRACGLQPTPPPATGEAGSITPEIRKRMDEDRATAEAAMMLYAHRPPTYWFADDANGNPCLFWRNPFSDAPEVLAKFMWPTHPKEWDVDGWWAKFTVAIVGALNPKPAGEAWTSEVEKARQAFYEAAARHFTIEFDCPVTEDGPPQEWYDDHDASAREAGQALRRLREAEARALPEAREGKS